MGASVAAAVRLPLPATARRSLSVAAKSLPNLPCQRNYLVRGSAGNHQRWKKPPPVILAAPAPPHVPLIAAADASEAMVNVL